MAKQVFSAYRAVQENNLYRNNCCTNKARHKDVTTGRYYCDVHILTVTEENRAELIKVRGSKGRYA